MRTILDRHQPELREGLQAVLAFRRGKNGNGDDANVAHSVRREMGQLDRLECAGMHAENIEALADVDLAGLPAPSADDEVTADLEVLEDALTRLPVVEREVLTLFYLRELTLLEVADTLQVPEGTVKSRLFRARNLLRQEITTSTSKGTSR